MFNRLPKAARKVLTYPELPKGYRFVLRKNKVRARRTWIVWPFYTDANYSGTWAEPSVESFNRALAKEAGFAHERWNREYSKEKFFQQIETPADILGAAVGVTLNVIPDPVDIFDW